MIGVIAAIAVGILQPQQVAAGNGLLIADGGKIVILEPHKWIGRRLPVLRDIVTAASGRPRQTDRETLEKWLSKGQWVVLFYHASCQECQRTIPLYEALAERDAAARSGPRVAFVRVESDPPGPLPAGLFTTNLALHGTLDAKHEWFAATPAGVELRNGKVLAVATGKAAMNWVWVK